MSAMSDFRQQCAAFDWQWDFSDDQQVWRNGRQAQEALYADAVRIGPDAIELYFDFVNRRISDH